MDFKSVKQLADLMEEYGLAHIEVQQGEDKIALTKPAVAVAPVQPAVVAAPAAVPAAVAEAPAEQAAAPVGEALNSPLVGVVYLAPSPDAKPFVGVGDAVKAGQTLCIVEAMKVMNEFTAPRDGEILEVCAENGALVECGQCLFRLK